MVKQLQFPKYLYWLLPVILYIILFEFIVPFSKVLPGPTLIWESLPALFKSYSLLFNLFYTASGIYVSMLAAYGFIYFTAGKTISFLHRNSVLVNIYSGLRYFPLAGLIAIFVFWFPVSNAAEYIFSISFAVIFLCGIIIANISRVKSEYIDSARSLGIKQSEIYSGVYWKSIQPALFRGVRKLHLRLWTVMIFFEFIKGDLGAGYIYRQALDFRDVSVLFTLSLIIMLAVFAGETVLKFLNKKIIYWEN